MGSYASNEPRIGKIRTVIGSSLTNHGFYFCRDAANAALFIRLAAFFADNLMNSVAHCGELSINVERLLRHIYELGAWLVM